MKLVIAEKPSVARSIAEVIGANGRQDGYLEGNGYLVSWCIGHLVELAEPAAYGAQYEKWLYETLPIIPQSWQHIVKPDTKDQFQTLKDLMHRNDIESVICATDAGREGELIFRLTYEQAGCTKPIERLWISSMEEKAIREGFSNLKPGSAYDNLYASARCRQEADWLVGLNGTRLFTVLHKKKLKVGRVQSPTLAMLVDRESQIITFKKEPYFITHAEAGGVDAVSEHIKEKADAEEIASACQGQDLKVTSVQTEDKSIATPKLYDLTSLQRDANRMYGFTAKQTLEYAQSLYEKKLMTYPRTDANFLTDDMEDTARQVRTISAQVLPFLKSSGGQFVDYARILNSKKVTDHHAIIPTVEIEKADVQPLPDGERKILYLIATRLFAATGEKHTYRSVKASFDCAGHVFTASGKIITAIGWKAYEDALKQASGADKEKDEEEKRLPELAEGMVLSAVAAKVTEHTTQPPKRYSEDSLLSAMERAGSAEMEDDVERKGLGTPATRADIIEKLVRDGFVKREKKNMVPTDDGMKLITVLPENLKSPQMTAEWENTLTLIAKGEYPADDFMEGIREMVRDLVKTYEVVREAQKDLFSGGDSRVLGECPNCGEQILSGKFGAYCKGKCGMSINKAYGKVLTEEQVKDVLARKKILVRGFVSKKTGKTYDAFLHPLTVVPYSYTGRDGKEHSGFQYRYEMTFPKKKKKGA